MNWENDPQYAGTDPELKELWVIELELLQKFSEVCDKYHLKWYADGGTLLGAVRHGGYIPWDDDIDIIMPYKDFTCLCSHADAFQEPYFLQNWKSQDGFSPYLCKLRKDNTTAYNDLESHCPLEWHRGVFIDIFALCDIPDNRLIAGTQWLMLKCIRALYLGYEAKRDRRTVTDRKWLDCILMLSYSLVSPICNYRELSDIYVSLGGWQKSTCKNCGPMLFSPGNKQLIWRADWFRKTVYLGFMDREIPCPAGYDPRLTCQYGDYMTPVHAPSRHGRLVINLKESYQKRKD